VAGAVEQRPDIRRPAANACAWVSNNVEGSYKRGVTLAMVIGLCVRTDEPGAGH
jgi:SLT domain-containing protein